MGCNWHRRRWEVAADERSAQRAPGTVQNRDRLLTESQRSDALIMVRHG